MICQSHVFSFCTEAALEHISSLAPEIQRMKVQAVSESLLMRLYDVQLLEYQSMPRDLQTDDPSITLLQTYCPWLHSSSLCPSLEMVTVHCEHCI